MDYSFIGILFVYCIFNYIASNFVGNLFSNFNFVFHVFQVGINTYSIYFILSRISNLLAF
jgi:hypothetical protein